MCGRYSLNFDNSFFDRFETTNRIELKPHFNVAPSQTMPVVLRHSPNHVELMKWGFVPHWEKGERPKALINLRDDTLLTKSWAKKYLETQRCIVPATGFFEWQKTEPGKQPMYIHLKDSSYFAFAGLYSVYTHPKTGDKVHTFAIITTSPNALMAPIHHRMPVILSPEAEETWLNPDVAEIEQLHPLLTPYPAVKMAAYPVSSRVNNPTQDTPLLIAALS